MLTQRYGSANVPTLNPSIKNAISVKQAANPTDRKMGAAFLDSRRAAANDEISQLANKANPITPVSASSRIQKLLSNERIFDDYPKMMGGIMKDLFVINGPSKQLRSKILPRLKKVGYMNLIKDAFKGVKSI